MFVMVLVIKFNRILLVKMFLYKCKFNVNRFVNFFINFIGSKKLMGFK